MTNEKEDLNRSRMNIYFADYQKDKKAHKLSSLSLSLSHSACKQLADLISTKGNPRPSANFNTIIVFLNPVSGGKPHKGKEVYHKIVKPMCEDAGYRIILQTSQYNRHATLLAFEGDFQGVSSILLIGGDGLTHEVINGIMQRTDWRTMTEQVILGIVPVGKVNELASRIYGPKHDHIMAVLAVLGRHSKKIDLIALIQDERRFYAHSSLICCQDGIKSSLFWTAAVEQKGSFSLQKMIKFIKSRTCNQFKLGFLRDNVNDEYLDASNYYLDYFREHASEAQGGDMSFKTVKYLKIGLHDGMLSLSIIESMSVMAKDLGKLSLSESFHIGLLYCKLFRSHNGNGAKITVSHKTALFNKLYVDFLHLYPLASYTIKRQQNYLADGEICSIGKIYAECLTKILMIAI